MQEAGGISTPSAGRARWPFLERKPDRTYHMPADRPQVPLLYSVQATRPRRDPGSPNRGVKLAS
jgi:hypothetical protein